MSSNDHWLNHNNLASYEKWLERQEQCIAPVLSNGQIRLCRNKITSDSQGAALWYKLSAESLPPGLPQRDVAVRHFIVMLCCEAAHHRSKIESQGLSKTLSNLVSDYRRAMDSPSTRYSTVPEPQVERAPQLPAASRFQRYRPREGDTVTVREELVNGVDSTFVRTGSVYCTTWPALPGYVKIGWTSGTASDRVDQQRNCLRDARVEASFVFPYPEKFERLIHRELRQARRIEGYCEGCGRTHTEFFEIRAVDAIHVMWEWYRLCRETSIYSSERTLHPYWYEKLNNLSEEVTAFDLLKVLYNLPLNPGSGAVDEVTRQLGRLSTRTN